MNQSSAKFPHWTLLYTSVLSNTTVLFAVPTFLKSFNRNESTMLQGQALWSLQRSHASGRRQPWLPVPVLTNMLDTGTWWSGTRTGGISCAFSKACCSLSHGWFLIAPHWGKIMSNPGLISWSKCLSSSCLACFNNVINQLGSSLLELETHAVVVPDIHFFFWSERRH